MAIKDLQKIPDSIFVVAVVLIMLVGAGLATYLANESTTSTSSTEPIRANQEAEDKAGTSRVTGVVTEVFRDCASRLVLVNGVVTEQGPVSCDGGSYITIDGGEEIFYASGFVARDKAFSYDIGDLVPGDTVEVLFQINEFGGSDLNCDACSVRILE